MKLPEENQNQDAEKQKPSEEEREVPPYSYLPTIPRSEARQCDKVVSMLWEHK